MNITLGQAIERTVIAIAILFAVIYLYQRFTADVPQVHPPADIVHDRCEYISDGQPFYIGNDDRTDIDTNDNGIACEKEDME